MDLDVIIFA